VNPKWQVGVRCVFLGQICSEVPEATIMSVSDECNPLNELLGSLWIYRYIFDIGKSIGVLTPVSRFEDFQVSKISTYNLGRPFCNAFIGLHNLFVADLRGLFPYFSAP